MPLAIVIKSSHLIVLVSLLAGCSGTEVASYRESLVLTTSLIQDEARRYQYVPLPFQETIGAIDASVWRDHLVPVSRLGSFMYNLINFGTFVDENPRFHWSIDASFLSIDTSISSDMPPHCPGHFFLDTLDLDLPVAVASQYDELAGVNHEATDRLLILMPGNRSSEQLLENKFPDPVLFCFGLTQSGEQRMVVEHLASTSTSTPPTRLEARIGDEGLQISIRNARYVARAPTALRPGGEFIEYSSRAIYSRGSARIEAWGRQFFQDRVSDFRVAECWNDDVVVARVVDGAELLPSSGNDDLCRVTASMLPTVSEEGDILP